MAPLAFHEEQDAMTLDCAREIIAAQRQFGRGYVRTAVRRAFGDRQRVSGQPAVDGSIREFDLETVFGLKPGADLRCVAG